MNHCRRIAYNEKSPKGPFQCIGQAMISETKSDPCFYKSRCAGCVMDLGNVIDKRNNEIMITK